MTKTIDKQIETIEATLTEREQNEYGLVSSMIKIAKVEVLTDIRDGTVPATVKSFSELHDYVDANDYGMWDDGAFVGDFGPKANKVQKAVDKWLKEGRP